MSTLHNDVIGGVQILRDALQAKLATLSTILIPLNDSEAVHAGSGSHWTWLLIQLDEHLGFHFNSKRNIRYSEDVAVRACTIFGVALDQEILYSEVFSWPQQRNDWQCGDFVCAGMLHTVEEQLLRFSPEQNITETITAKQLNVAGLRQGLLAWLHHLRQEHDKTMVEQEQREIPPIVC